MASLGVANPIFSMVEDIFSLLIVLIALLAPFLALIGILFGLGILVRRRLGPVRTETGHGH